ncbi:MAG: Spy/CpxP family protein refolding chaperone [Burkholderiales bacterium]
MNPFRKYALIGIVTAGIAVTSLAVFARSEKCEARHRDPAQAAAWIQRRQAELHDKLQLDAAQEVAWQDFSKQMQPAMGRDMQDPAQWSSLRAPERMERMLAAMKAREEKMADRIAAVKTFYAVLSPEQQSVFDAQFAAHKRHQPAGT